MKKRGAMITSNNNIIIKEKNNQWSDPKSTTNIIFKIMLTQNDLVTLKKKTSK